MEADACTEFGQHRGLGGGLDMLLGLAQTSSYAMYVYSQSMTMDSILLHMWKA